MTARGPQCVCALFKVSVRSVTTVLLSEHFAKNSSGPLRVCGSSVGSEQLFIPRLKVNLLLLKILVSRSREEISCVCVQAE